MSIHPNQENITALDSFLHTPLDIRLGHHLKQAPETAVLALYRKVAANVPAYRQFLAKHNIEPGKISTFADFQCLPLMTKQNYVLAYPLMARCYQGRLDDNEMIAISSGSTGNPTAWPRSTRHELDIAIRFEQIFNESFHADDHSTLAVICFALGSWVGGIYTAGCCRYLALKGYRITVVTPGNNKEEIFRVINDIGADFDQVVLLGYPPFIKDVIDNGIARNIDWPRFNIKMVFAGEVFSEEWRDLVCHRAGTGDPDHTTASLYGTADAGVLANETPLSIKLRKFFAGNPEIARHLFGESRLPTLVQYDPLSRFFEVHNDTLVVTGDNGVPLVRYHIADKGGIITHEEMKTIIGDQLDQQGLEALNNASTSLPFVYIFGRADFTVSFFGANIYPENVTVGLEQAKIQQWVTGKFVLQAKETADNNKALGITVELMPGVVADDNKATRIANSIREQLLRLNSEFAHYVPAEFQQPEVALRPSGDAEYFPAGVKHRYSRK